MTTRKEYIEMLAGKLREWDAAIDDLKLKAETAGVELKARYKLEIMELRQMRARAAGLLSEMHEAGDGTWKTVKARVDGLYREAREIFKKAA